MTTDAELRRNLNRARIPAELRLERRDQENETPVLSAGGTTMLLTPPLTKDYWAYRVAVGEGQAIVGFPKFLTIGIGFAVEEDWNTNLPFTCSTEEIWNHIKHNKGPEPIPDEWCIQAIQMIREAAAADCGVVLDKGDE